MSAAVLTCNFPQGTNKILFDSIRFLPTIEKHETSSVETNSVSSFTVLNSYNISKFRQPFFSFCMTARHAFSISSKWARYCATYLS